MKRTAYCKDCKYKVDVFNIILKRIEFMYGLWKDKRKKSTSRN